LGLGFVDVLTWEPAISSPIVEHMNGEMDTRKPDLVLVGNSEVYFSVDPELLGQELGVEVVMLSATNTAMPYWYAVVKNRVFGRGHRPQAVLVMGDLPRLLQSRAAVMDSTELLEQLEDDEPVIGQKVFGNDDGSVAVARWRAQRAKKRDGFVEPFKDSVVGLLWGTGSVSERLTQGKEIADEAGAKVFDPAKAIDLDLRKRVIPVAESGGGEEVELESDASLVPDLIELTAEGSSQLILVRAPLRSDNPAANVAPQVEAQFESLLDAPHVHLIENSGAELKDEHFIDIWHLKAEQQRAHTLALAKRLRELGIFSAR
jgi:hypothetical protein